MADGDIKTNAERDVPKERYLGSTLLSFGDEYYVEARLKCDDLDAGTLLDAAGRLTKSAAAALHVTRMRGEDSNDSPGTLADALDAVQVCLELAVGFRAAAQQLQKEKAHG